MNKWLNQNKLEPKMKEELLKMTNEELEEAFSGELSFGTGGMRGIVGPGTNRMNKYVLRKTNYGYAKYLLNKFKTPSVVIAYDSRNYSLEFAKDSASVLASFGVKVYLFAKITPTPELSFAIRHLKAQGGIVITASHNPPQYNGYKVYDDTGCQLVPALVEDLTIFIKTAPDMFLIEPKSWDELLRNKMIEYVDSSLDEEYLKRILTLAVHPQLTKQVSVIYTPLHGTGGHIATQILQKTGYPFQVVASQMIADPLFSTVKSPNPESIAAFDLAKKQANKKYSLLIATDPDADRIGICVLHNNEYHFLTGNQTGALLLDYFCKYRYFEGTVFNTIVTSDLGAAIAKKNGLKVISTLTGFKFIGQQAALLEAQGGHFFFGYEESYGYLISDFVRDKDSLQSLLAIVDMANYYSHHNKTLVDRLYEIYQEYGYYYDHLINIQLEGIAGQTKIKHILDYFRKASFSFKIIKKEDYLESIRYFEDKKEIINLPKENVLKFYLDDYSWFVIRPSGTEPKMKIYFSLRSNNHDEAEKYKNRIESEILAMIEGVE